MRVKDLERKKESVEREEKKGEIETYERIQGMRKEKKKG
jgi:hypothetical protein